MVRCNLSVLLAERNLKITKVSQDTGISRTTLTALSNNYSQGIQFETLNALCIYLQVEPNQIISYLPFNVTVDVLSDENMDSINQEIAVTLSFSEKSNEISFMLVGMVHRTYTEKLLSCVRVVLRLHEHDEQSQDDRRLFAYGNKVLQDYFAQLSPGFLNDLSSKIFNHLTSDFALTVENLACELTWPRELR